MATSSKANIGLLLRKHIDMDAIRGYVVPTKHLFEKFLNSGERDLFKVINLKGVVPSRLDYHVCNQV